jgi:hypothetical protein
LCFHQAGLRFIGYPADNLAFDFWHVPMVTSAACLDKIYAFTVAISARNHSTAGQDSAGQRAGATVSRRRGAPTTSTTALAEAGGLEFPDSRRLCAMRQDLTGCA